MPIAPVRSRRRLALVILAGVAACAGDEATSERAINKSVAPGASQGIGGTTVNTPASGGSETISDLVPVPNDAGAGGVSTGGANGVSSGSGGAAGKGAAGNTDQAGTTAIGGSHATGGSNGASSAGETATGGLQGTGGSSAGTSGAGGASGAPACADWNPCDDGDSSTTGDVCLQGVCAGAAASDSFVVHEWGTYTSVKASDGHTLGGVHHIDEALPAWVHARATGEPWGYDVEGLPDEPLQQLETPVLYFHSPKPRFVRVDVSFPQGVVGEWYPSASTFSPPIDKLTAIANGAMSWGLALDHGISPSTFPPVSIDEIWAPSRNVDATPVRALDGERERFIFYRGLAKFDPPVSVTAPSDVQLHVTSSASETVAAAFLLLVTDTGGAFLPIGAVPGVGGIDVAVPAPSMTSDGMIAAARAGLLEALVATGLYDDEAQAMVDTWARSWLKAKGLRILYVAPRAWTDGWLPMSITPAPASTVRTLVGRVEILTPGVEAADRAKITSLAKMGTYPNLALLGFDRFAESRLFRALELLTDPNDVAFAKELQQAEHGVFPYP